MTEWIWRNHVIVPAQDADIIRAIAKRIDPDPGSVGGFWLGLSANGEEPVTHVAADSPITQAMLNQMQQALMSWQQEGLSAMPMFWRMHAGDTTLAASNVSVEIGESWSFDRTLDAAGLKKVIVEQGT